jgi:acyl-coenzyme A thioesterase PaaI-like protein
MAMLELPHSAGCLVCGRSNPHGLKLSLNVDDATGEVCCSFTPGPEHVGFDGIIHGGALSAVVDEAMVWAASWRGRRFCFCGEMTVRFRHPVVVNQPLIISAVVEFSRPKLIETAAKIFDDEANKLVATGNGKYVPVTPEQHKSFIATMLDEPATNPALAILRI